jgi:hypothetical protein
LALEFSAKPPGGANCRQFGGEQAGRRDGDQIVHHAPSAVMVMLTTVSVEKL